MYGGMVGSTQYTGRYGATAVCFLGRRQHEEGYAEVGRGSTRVVEVDERARESFVSAELHWQRTTCKDSALNVKAMVRCVRPEHRISEASRSKARPWQYRTPQFKREGTAKPKFDSQSTYI
eukprot:1072281-Rhodomonas_salina.5